MGHIMDWMFNNIKWLLPILSVFLFTGFFAKLMKNLDRLKRFTNRQRTVGNS
jgi:hypothetical protein